MTKRSASDATTIDAMVNQPSKKAKTVHTPTQQVVPATAQRRSLSAMLASIAFMPNGAPIDAPSMDAEPISRQCRGLELAKEVINEGFRQGLEAQSKDVIAALLRSEGSGSRADGVQPGLSQAGRVAPVVSGPKGTEPPHGGPSSRRPPLASGPIRITDTNSAQKRKRTADEDGPLRKRLGVAVSTNPRSVAADALLICAADMSEVPDGGNIQPTVVAARRKRIPRWRPESKGIHRTCRDDGEPPRQRLGVTLSKEPHSVAADSLLVSPAVISEVPDGGNIQPTVAAARRKRIPRWRPKIKGVNRTWRDERSGRLQEPEVVGGSQVPQVRDAIPVVLSDARRRLSELEAMMALPQMTGQREATLARMELQTLIFSLEKIYT